jgi:tellurite resistance protein
MTLQGLTRDEMTAFIAKSDLPLQARVMANLFIAQCDDQQIRYLGEQAQGILAHVETKDRPGFENALKALGLPMQFITFLSSKAFANADPNQGR